MNANLVGSFDSPSLTGEAVVTEGRLRPPASAHGLEAVNGRIVFEETGVNLNGVTGRVAGGDVTFGGSIVREGYRLTEYNISAVGRSLRLRYPSGFNSTVNLDLRLVGPLTTPRLIGSVDVLRMVLTGGGATQASVFGLAGVSATDAPVTTAPSLGPVAANTSGAVGLDVDVTVPRWPFWTRVRPASRARRTCGSRERSIDRSSMARLTSTGGHWQLGGNRVFIRESSIDFRNSESTEPYFDFNADTRVRTPGQTVDIRMRITGQPSALTPTFTSDPPLPTTDVISLLLGGTTDLDTASQRALSSPQESQQRMMQTTATFLLASPISSRVGDVFERTGRSTSWISPRCFPARSRSSSSTPAPVSRSVAGFRRESS